MDYEKSKVVAKDAFHVVSLIALVLIILGLVTYLGFIKCSSIPGWCSVYDAVLGKPRVLIAFGNDGLGEPEVLAQMLSNPKNLGVRPTLIHIDRINAGNLRDYQLVIVEHAKTMNAKKMGEFIAYADSGGRLVWTGDAGTASAPDELLYEDDLDKNEAHEAFGPWARKLEGQTVRLDQLISVQFLLTYCGMEGCSEGLSRVGRLDAPDPNHALVVGLNPSLSLYGDFAVVEEGTGIGSKRVLNIELGSQLLDPQKKELGNIFPAIVVSYYAVPPEQFWIRTPELSEPVRSTLLVENMYLGLVR